MCAYFLLPVTPRSRPMRHVLHCHVLLNLFFICYIITCNKYILYTIMLSGLSHIGSAESQGWTRDRGPSLSSLTVSLAVNWLHVITLELILWLDNQMYFHSIHLTFDSKLEGIKG